MYVDIQHSHVYAWFIYIYIFIYNQIYQTITFPTALRIKIHVMSHVPTESLEDLHIKEELNTRL